MDLSYELLQFAVTTLYLSLSWAKKLDAVTRVSTADPEGFLGHPVNAYKLMKRLNTEWTELESLVLQSPSDGKEKGRKRGKEKKRKCSAIISD